MRQLIVFGVAMVAFAALLGADTPARAQPGPGLPPVPPVPALEYVVLQRDVGALAQRADGLAPSLEELGFERVPVPPGMSASAYAATLAREPGIVSAEPDGMAYAAATPNDPFYVANQQAYMSLIGAPEAWDLVTGAGEPTIVAVLDSGTDIRHPELNGRTWENTRDASSDGIDDDRNGCTDDRYGCRMVELTTRNRDACGYTSSAWTGSILDDHGRPGTSADSHGTLVAGIIGAAGNNGVGVTGAAWNARLMTVKVLDCGSGPGGGPAGTTFAVAKGIDYARLNGARIINLSLTSDDLLVLREAIAAAEAEGIIIVAAAGNHVPGSNQVGTSYPAAYTQYTNVVAVGASDVSGQWATFSNYGPAIDIAAPGVAIAGTRRTDIGLAQPYGSDPQGGTSFAVPLVSGVFALMISRNPHLPMLEYIESLKSTASAAPPAEHGQNWAGAGIVSAGDAVARVPMNLSGNALIDFLDVPAGTEVRAIIGGLECGKTVSTLFGRVALYSLRVRSAVERPGCGEPGAEVRFEVGGFAVPAPLTWGERDEVIGYPNHDLSGVSPPPGDLVIQELNGGWSNIAHLDAGGPLPAALNAFPATWNHVLRWDPTAESLLKGAYRRFIRDVPLYVNDFREIARYDAIWIETAKSNVATTNPRPAPGRTITLHEGWNNIVYTGTTAAVADALASIDGKYAQVLRYDNPAFAWRSYLPGQARYLNDFGGLFQLQTYWILMTAEAQLTMH